MSNKVQSFTISIHIQSHMEAIRNSLRIQAEAAHIYFCIFDEHCWKKKTFFFVPGNNNSNLNNKVIKNNRKQRSFTLLIQQIKLKLMNKVCFAHILLYHNWNNHFTKSLVKYETILHMCSTYKTAHQQPYPNYFWSHQSIGKTKRRTKAEGKA